MASAEQEFSGQITVAARIIDLLSSGLYESPASCLKELVNNSFDADATEVLVFVKPDANRIIVQDNGQGMSRAEFERHFKRIAESHKRDDSDETASGRKKIGKIGIGVVAANELCEKLEIFSTKRGSTELLWSEHSIGALRPIIIFGMGRLIMRRWSLGSCISSTTIERLAHRTWCTWKA